MIILSQYAYNKTSREGRRLTSRWKVRLPKAWKCHELYGLEDVVAGHAEIEEKERVRGVLLLEEGEEVASVQGAEGRVETRVRGRFGETVKFSQKRGVGG